MTDIIGVLGENDDGTVGTHTVYTVPAGKAARVQVMYRGQADASSPDLNILVNGMRIMRQSGITGSNYVWSTKDTLFNSNAAEPDGSAAGQVVAKYNQDFYLSAGDTLQFVVGSNDFSAFEMFVVGSEIDVA